MTGSRLDKSIGYGYLDSQFNDNPMRDDTPYPIPPDRSSGTGGVGATIQGTLVETRIESEGEFAGKRIGTVKVHIAPCDREDLLPEMGEGGLEYVEVDVVDHSGCIFDLDDEELGEVWIWASEGIAPNPDYDPNETIPDPEDPEGPEIPNPSYDPEKATSCHWCADDRCCVEADYPPPEEEE